MAILQGTEVRSDQLYLWKGEGGAVGEVNENFLEEMTTEPKKVNSSLSGRWTRVGRTFLEE